MAAASSESLLPPLTRFAHAAGLLAAQGLAVGFAINTFRLWSKLPDFVATNKIATGERNSILLWLVAPSAAWFACVLLVALVRRSGMRRLLLLENWAQLGAWLIAAGLLPMLFHPALWRIRGLTFLLTTGVVTLASWWAIRLTQKGLGAPTVRSADSDLRRIAAYLDVSIPPKLRVLAPILVIALAVAYIALRGVWLDPSAVPQRVGHPPLGVNSLRQGFQILGHGGWLSIAVASMKFLRPPGHAHIFVWVLCVSSAAFSLFGWARRHVGVGVALILALAYLSMPALRTIGRAEVFPLGTAAGLFFASVTMWERRAYRIAALLTLLAVGLHEQAALWFACLGVYWTGRDESAGMGRWLAVGGLAYFSVVALFVLPHFGLDPYAVEFRGLWGSKSVGLVETLKVAATNPAFVLASWLERQGLEFWLWLFVPFAFIPIAARNWLLWVIPGALFAVVAHGRAPGLPITGGAAVHFIVLGFVASVASLAQLRARSETRSLANATVIAWVLAVVPCAYQLGGLWLPAM